MQKENYVGSQQHFEDNINANYDERERHDKEQIDDRVQQREYSELEINIHTVCSAYPDAYCRKYAKLSIVIWSTLLDYRLSGFFHTEDEAWSDAVKWINKKINSHF
jgi:hypothetical protein